MLSALELLAPHIALFEASVDAPHIALFEESVEAPHIALLAEEVDAPHIALFDESVEAPHIALLAESSELAHTEPAVHIANAPQPLTRDQAHAHDANYWWHEPEWLHRACCEG